MNPIITMRHLGSMGRAGNQIFQFAWIKLYAQKYDASVELPSWVGNELFGANDLPITHWLAEQHEVWRGNHLDEQIPPIGDEYLNHDAVGYFQYHTSYYSPYKDQFRSFFQPIDSIRKPLEEAFCELRSLGKTVIGLHIRRSDYGRLIFHMTPIEWYKRWLAENWQRFENPVLFVATEDRSLVAELEKWGPVTTDDCGVKLAESRQHYNYLPYDLIKRDAWQLDWYPDFYFLSQCHVLVISNSTFGFSAAMMNPYLRECWRSSLPHAGFEKIDPWDSRPMRLERCEDFPDLEGISCKTNPYW